MKILTNKKSIILLLLLLIIMHSNNFFLDLYTLLKFNTHQRNETDFKEEQKIFELGNRAMPSERSPVYRHHHEHN
jgi:hypothetical protein